MFPHSNQERGDDEEYLGSSSDIEQVIDVIWAQLQVQYGVGSNDSLNQDLATLALKSIMNELGGSPDGEGCDDILELEIETQMKALFTK